MSDPKKVRIATDFATLSQIARFGARLGWQARDEQCRDHYCGKCHRKSGHSGSMMSTQTESSIGQQVLQALAQQFERQAAQRRYLEGRRRATALVVAPDGSPLVYDQEGEN